MTDKVIDKPEIPAGVNETGMDRRMVRRRPFRRRLWAVLDPALLAVIALVGVPLPSADVAPLHAVFATGGRIVLSAAHAI